MREVEVEPDYGIPADAIECCRFVAEPVKARPFKVVKPHELREPPKNYGADINTLIELLEAGKL
jgi:transposase